MSGVSALIDIYKMTEVSVEERIRLLHALGEIVNYEINLLEEMDLLYAKIHRLEDICEQANIMLNQRDEIEEGLNKRIAKLEGFINQLIEAGDAMSNAQSMWVAEENKWNAIVAEYKEREE